MQRIFLVFSFLPFLFFNCETGTGPQPSILVFTKTETYRHASIETGEEVLKKLGMQNNFSVDFTENNVSFTEINLKKYAAVIFLNTSGDVLNNRQQADFQRFIEAGGGFVGIHGAAATEYDWHWYGNLVGAYLSGHPPVQTANVHVIQDDETPVDNFQIRNEWCNFRPVPPVGKVWVNAPNTLISKTRIGPVDSLRQLEKHIDKRVAWTYDPTQPFLQDGTKVLLEVDEKSYEGGSHGDAHPISWKQEYEGGRSFYTALGHTTESYADANFLQHLLAGIKFAISDAALDYSKTKTERIPPEDRFVRTVLASNLNEPMELEIMPDGKVMFLERRGAMKIYDPVSDTVETVLHMPVYDNNEEGFLGMALDPNWEENHWIYLFFSLMEGGRRNRLSRYVFDGKMLHVATEIMMLEVPEIDGCCHTGGSIEFGPDGNLYLSTGDNTNPFESAGYGPFDERPGRALWDAQKSSANPNDLRGKVLRITPQPDGSYTIPKGNLFPEGTDGTLPEIYVMGCRNPFRISIDSKTGCLLWGDIGPDAGKDGQVRGPKGYDTFNRACEAGFYGWPYVRGNHVYQDYDFATKNPGRHFDPENIVNNSPNNTGLQELPPVQHPLIWYSYDESTEFPWMATGGKNPMAGPVFHAADYSDGVNIYPSYFENKFFVYEWMRNWIFIVTLDEEGNYVQADPFMPNEKFVRPMDMAFGPDGALYILEYGEAWFSANPDARLNKIEYAPGNRKPIANITKSKYIGAEPLTVKLSASESTDYDGDRLQYDWYVKGMDVRTSGANLIQTFSRPGKYEVVLNVTDPSGASSRAKTEIFVGNEPPKVAWELGGNQSFYWDDSEIPYQVQVTDKEDGSLADGEIDSRRLHISIDYLKEGKDVAQIVLGHQTQSLSAGRIKFSGGKKLIENSDCGTCHAERKKINGPSYIDIAKRYFGDEFAVTKLAEKVIDGGGGNWGETSMAAHPQITQKESEEIVQYILSLAGEVQSDFSLPSSGTYQAIAHFGGEENGAYIFQASYLDAGAGGMASLSAAETMVLRHPKMEAETFSDASPGIRKIKDSASGSTLLTGLVHERYLTFSKIDLTDVGGIQLDFFNNNTLAGTLVEIRIGAPNGKLIGKGDVELDDNQLTINLTDIEGIQDVVFVFKNNKNKEKEIGMLDWLFFEKRNKGIEE